MLNDEERDQLLTQLVEHPRDREAILNGLKLGADEREELLQLAKTVDSLWLSAQHPPALEDDPVAAMLGLVPDRECSLDGGALSNARKRARLKVSDVAARLQAQGWQFETNDVFRWETRSAADVPPAVVQAVAEVLGASVEGLISLPETSSLPDYFSAVRAHPLFAQLVDRWAQAQRVSRAVAAATLDSRMLATVHRGERPDAEQILSSLEALVASIERTDKA